MTRQPTPFALSETEAHTLMGVQSQNQAQFARGGKVQRWGAGVAPIVALGVLAALNWCVYDGAMPAPLFFGILLAYLFGLGTTILTLVLFTKDTKARMLRATPQVWETRTITIDEAGLRQKTDTSQATFLWSGINKIDVTDTMLLVWIHKFSAIAIPHRAFPNIADARAFEAEARKLLAAHHPA
ncbi:MAG: YcxB family protein [Alphaproteobacteria bacterium]|nr:YcxB family protein [Alphaproteobacteria bacterium]